MGVIATGNENCTKVCPQCHRELPVTKFYASRSSADGLQSWCKECQKERSKDIYSRAKAERPIPTGEGGLSKFTPRQLMEELRRRGYTGTLRYVQEIDIARI